MHVQPSVSSQPLSFFIMLYNVYDEFKNIIPPPGPSTTGLAAFAHGQY